MRYLLALCFLTAPCCASVTVDKENKTYTVDKFGDKKDNAVKKEPLKKTSREKTNRSEKREKPSRWRK